MRLTVQHVRLGNVRDKDGALIYNGDVLVAVLSQLSIDHGERAGYWFIECGFGGLETRDDFPTLAAACEWIEGWLAEQAD